MTERLPRVARLEGKVALITGAARGIGAATAAMFADEGATVIVVDVIDDAGEETARSIGADYAHLDVTSQDDWRRVADDLRTRFARLDVLVNNAGVVSTTIGRVDQIPVDEHLRLFDVNVHGPFYGIRTMLPLLEAGSGASVINISSIDGLVGVPFLASYVASKHALTGLTRTVAIELGPLGIRVNSIHPGVIETPLVRSRGDAALARLSRTLEMQPLRRIGQPDEVAAMALFLASDESSYCTGSEFRVDGGHLTGPFRPPPA